MAVLEEFVAEEVGKSVVFLVEGENCGVGSTCSLSQPEVLDL